MKRKFVNDRDAFPKSAEELARQVMPLLQHRRADMDAAWATLEEGWKEHNERMVTLEVRPRTNEEDMLKLNVGGSVVNVRWHLLAETEGFKDSVLGALLEGVWGRGRIPRDADGRIVLDESPGCIKHIIHKMLTDRAGSVEVGQPECWSRSAVATDEVPCLIYTTHVMGLPGYEPAHPKYVCMKGGSTSLEPSEIAPFCATMRDWVGGSTEPMNLIHRATRDGFDTKSLKAGYNENCPHTVSLLRVSSGQENGYFDDSIVGGYSIVLWGSGVGSGQIIAAEMFLFMLKNGSAARTDPRKPVKWNPYPKSVGRSFTVNKVHGVCVGGSDLYTTLDATTGGCTLVTGRETFAIEKDSPFLALKGKKIVDYEVYSYSIPAPPPTTPAPSITKPDAGTLTDAEARDIDSFGRLIASSLMEERVVLDRAVKEMESAGASVSAAVRALETVYGPRVAAGEPDAVVELNVRGTRMTTLLSTLQACPRSALATIFKEEWPAVEKDKGQDGGRLIDCDRSCFSKILDVLRMRKRASWNRGTAGRGKGEEKEENKGKKKEKKEKGGESGEEESSKGVSGAVLIKQGDVEAFDEVVNMYFPGCESFIMDLVQPA